MTQTESGDTKNGEGDDSRQESRKSLRKSWRSSGPVAKLTVVFAGISAVATVLYCLIAGLTLYEIHSGSTDTKAIANAAGKQADAANTLATQASKQTDKMSGSLDQLKIQAAATNILATASTRSADAAEDSMRLDQRAWVYPMGYSIEKEPGAGEAVSMDFRLANSGNTPGIEVVRSNQISIMSKPLGESKRPDWSTISRTEPIVVFPTSTDGFNRGVATFEIRGPADATAVEEYRAKRARLFLRIYISYRDVFKRSHFTEACVYREFGEPTGLVTVCKGGNITDGNGEQKR